MALLKPFRGWRPKPEFAKKVASRPYDVLTEKEAAAEAEGNPLSFYHVVKPEIDLLHLESYYVPEVYQKGADNFQKLVDDGVILQDSKPSIYIYQQVMDGRAQTGILGCAAVDEYFNGTIKIHELTRPDKEEDRKNHVRYGQMHAESMIFAYRQNDALDGIVNKIITAMPDYDFVADDGIAHRLWAVDDEQTIISISEAFATIPNTYVADGHHRTASAALVGRELAKANPTHTGNEGYNFFMAVHFPDSELQIMDYNRVVKDLNGLSAQAFKDRLDEPFQVEQQAASYRPQALHELSMYLDGTWYKLTAKPGTYDDSDPIKTLDVTVLSEQVLDPLLGISDLRTDKRIDFVGGIRGLEELQRRVDSGEMAVAFALYPVSMKQLMDIADADLIMPPKVTWFEPKLRSGLVVHKFG